MKDYKFNSQPNRETSRLCEVILEELNNIEVHNIWISAVLLNPGTKHLGILPSGLRQPYLERGKHWFRQEQNDIQGAE